MGGRSSAARRGRPAGVTQLRRSGDLFFLEDNIRRLNKKKLPHFAREALARHRHRADFFPAPWGAARPGALAREMICRRPAPPLYLTCRRSEAGAARVGRARSLPTGARWRFHAGGVRSPAARSAASFHYLRLGRAPGYVRGGPGPEGAGPAN